MAHIQDRGRGVTRRWQARYRDPSGREKSRTFTRKLDAQRWLDEMTADLMTGRYVDPRAGTVKLADYAMRWLEVQTFGETTRETTAGRLRVHILPALGGYELRTLRPSTVQAWVAALSDELAPSYVAVILGNLSSVLGSAVDDGLIAVNPCDSPSVKAPKVVRRQVVPWSVETVANVVDSHVSRYRAVPVVGAGCGLRQGEIFGLRVTDVDFLRRRLLVRQQVRLIAGEPTIGPPKGRRTREVPLPDIVAEAIAERLRQYPARDGLVFTSREGGLLNRNYFNPRIWKPALTAAGVEPTRENGMHALRHHYASVLLDGGVSIRALAEYLGHSDPGFTLRVYAHLMPDSEDRARSVVEASLRGAAESVRNARPSNR